MPSPTRKQARNQPILPRISARILAPSDTVLPEHEDCYNHRILSTGEERDLADRIKAGGADAEDAITTLVEHNLRLARNYAARYMGGRSSVGSLTFDDIEQMARIGILKAARRYDGRGRFSTYATWWMRQEVNRASELTAEMIRLPVYVQAAIRAVKHARDAGFEPNEDDVRHAAQAIPQPISANMPVHLHEGARPGHNTDAVDVGDLAADPRDFTEYSIAGVDASRLVPWINSILDPTEALVFWWFIGRDEDDEFQEMANRIQRTRQGVHLILKRARWKLRAAGLTRDGSIDSGGDEALKAQGVFTAIQKTGSMAPAFREAQQSA